MDIALIAKQAADAAVAAALAAQQGTAPKAPEPVKAKRTRKPKASVEVANVRLERQDYSPVRRGVRYYAFGKDRWIPQAVVDALRASNV